MIGSILFAAFSIIFCVIFCWFRTAKATVYSLMLKTVSSICFILCGIFAIKMVGESSFNLLVIVGLVLGLVGDIVLDLKIMYPNDGQKYFVAGTSSFAIGHLFYFLAVVLYNSAVTPNTLAWNILAAIGVAIILTLAILLPSKKMGLNFGKNIYIVAFYSVVLSFMMAYTIAVAIFNPIFWIFASGMILFFLSDLILSLQYFGGKDQKIWVYLNHILYYLAQTMLAFSLLYIVM